MVSFEIFASALTQDERCASPLFVIQSAPPRPWAFAASVHAIRQAKQTMIALVNLFILEAPWKIALQ
jgi:hypothetical protein